MSFALEFSDSEILDIVAEPAGLRVRLAAAAVRDAGARRGWIPSVQLTLADATVTGDLRHAFGKITDGQLRHDSKEVALLALPCMLSGRLALSLRLANGSSLEAQARALTATFDGEARFTPDLSC